MNTKTAARHVKPSTQPIRKKKPRFVIRALTGPVHSGKTSFLLGEIRARSGQGLRVNGILSLAVFEDGVRLGYDALDLRSGERFPLLRAPAQEGWIKVGPFGMMPEGFRRAEAAVSHVGEADLTVIDELGPLELGGGGFWPCLKRLRARERVTLVVIRETLLEAFGKLLGDEWAVHTLGEPGLGSRLFTLESGGDQE